MTSSIKLVKIPKRDRQQNKIRLFFGWPSNQIQENTMKGKFHGVASLFLIFAAVIIALIYMPTLAINLGSKCLCREEACSHVFPGMLTRLLPTRKQGPYTIGDYFWTGVSLIALLGFPQVWLWQHKTLFVVFWILLIVGLIEILFLVCPRCQNENCPNCNPN
jgi:hypothetical protein